MANNTTIKLLFSMLIGALSGVAWTSISEANQSGDTRRDDSPQSSFEIGGFAKTDLIFSDFSNGELSANSLGRDLYVPATIPVGGLGDRYTDMHAKESRINFSAIRMLESGTSLKAFLEVDFLECSDGATDLYESLRLRHLFVQYGDWLVGQTWTTLFNVSALPENLDFIGPSESTIFRRQAMVRYSHGPWQFALENPRTTLTPYGGGKRIISDNNEVPDAVLRYNHEGKRSTFTAAAITRQLIHENNALGIDETATGWGISLSGKVNIGTTDDFRWMASTGNGLGHYIGLNTAKAAVLDAEGGLEPIASTGVFGSVRHFWNSDWRSNLTLGYLDIDNEATLTGESVTKSAFSTHINLIYRPWPSLDVGVELLVAQRELESTADGDLKRMQFSLKYMY